MIYRRSSRHAVLFRIIVVVYIGGLATALARAEPGRPSRDLPVSFDWRDFNVCRPIKNTGACGCAWASAPLDIFESAILISDHTSVDLSEQWLISCTDAGGCSGGSYADALEYLRCDGLTDPCGDSGAVLEADFPYVGWEAPCECPYPHPYCLDAWAYVGDGLSVPDPAALKQAIYDHGPVVAGVYVDAAFQAYSCGIFNESADQPVNHAVVLVGWGQEGGIDYWILRNCWGDAWGESGCMRIAFGCSRIGYASAYVDYHWQDCNDNDRHDAVEIITGASPDANANGVPDECDCPGDLDNDFDIDLGDLGILLAHYGTTSGAGYWNGDINFDGQIDMADLCLLLAVYGTTCE